MSRTAVRIGNAGQQHPPEALWAAKGIKPFQKL